VQMGPARMRLRSRIRSPVRGPVLVVMAGEPWLKVDAKALHES
jgi:hypothetical protein